MNKILVDATCISNPDTKFTGIPWYVFNILKNVGLNKRQFIALFAPYDSKPSSIEETYNALSLNINRKFGDLRFFTFGGFKINKFEHNVYWSPAFRIPRFMNSNKKIVVTVHDINPFKHLDDAVICSDWYSKIKNEFRLSNIKYSIKRANEVISISQSAANEIEDFFKLSKVKIVTPAYDKELFKPVINSEELFFNKYRFKGPFILIGNMKYPCKNFEFVVEAFQNVKVKGILCAFGTLSVQQIEFARKVLGSRFIHLGYVDEGDLPVIYSAANFVAASKDEGFDMPPLEARACGTYVIASDIPVHYKVLENEAEYFELNDLDRLSKLMSEALSTNKVVIPSKIVEKYDWKRSADKMIEILENGI